MKTGNIRNFIFGAVLALALTPAAAQAQMLSSVNADQLEAALADAGLNPTMMTDQTTGAPVAVGQAGPFNFYVRTLSCSGTPKSCETLMFFANFSLDRPVAGSDYIIVNSFNDSHVFGRAYVLNGSNEVGVDYVIELNGGVSQDHLAQNISRWADVIASFVAAFQEGEPTS